MRIAAAIALVLALSTPALARGHGGSRSSSTRSSTPKSSGSGTVHVNGYTKKNGTYVAPHNQTAPDKSKANNWSTKGNVNPETGKQGTVDPYKKK